MLSFDASRAPASPRRLERAARIAAGSPTVWPQFGWVARDSRLTAGARELVRELETRGRDAVPGVRESLGGSGALNCEEHAIVRALVLVVEGRFGQARRELGELDSAARDEPVAILASLLVEERAACLDRAEDLLDELARRTSDQVIVSLHRLYVAYARWRSTGSDVDRERFAALADRRPDLDPRRGSDPEIVLYDLMATTARFVGGRLSGAERGAVRSRLAAWRSFGGDDLFSVCVRYRAARLADELGS